MCFSTEAFITFSLSRKHSHTWWPVPSSPNSRPFPMDHTELIIKVTGVVYMTLKIRTSNELNWPGLVLSQLRRFFPLFSRNLSHEINNWHWSWSQHFPPLVMVILLLLLSIVLWGLLMGQHLSFSRRGHIKASSGWPCNQARWCNLAERLTWGERRKLWQLCQASFTRSWVWYKDFCAMTYGGWGLNRRSERSRKGKELTNL